MPALRVEPRHGKQDRGLFPCRAWRPLACCCGYSLTHAFVARSLDPEGRRDQRPGIVGLRALENLLRRPELDDLAVAHDDDVVGERADDLEVVADEEIGEIVLCLQVAQQVDDLRLHAHVERRGRLVEHDEVRLQHHGAGNRDALALAAGEFVRIAEARLGIEPDLVQHLDHPARPAPAADSDGSWIFSPSSMISRHRHARAERAERILEDDLQFAPQRPHRR